MIREDRNSQSFPITMNLSPPPVYNHFTVQQQATAFKAL